MLNIIKKIPLVLHSLRMRAILFSVAISLLIAVISYIGYSNFNTFSDKSSFQLEQRNALILKVSLIRRELLESYKELNNFLLAPEEGFHQKKVLASIDALLSLNKQLVKHSWIKKYEQDDIASKLSAQLALLKSNVIELIKVRSELTNQYPSLAVSAEVMQPNRNRLNNLLALAINEALNDELPISNPKVYQTLIQLRHLWGQVLSNYRLYLANRVGSFNVKALPTQENAIKVMFNEMKSELAEFKKFADAEKLGFETTDSIDLLLESTNAWFGGFKRVQVIHHSNEWRHDAQIMKEIISPRIDLVVELLVTLDNIITSSAESDIKIYESLGKSQNRILWFIALLGIFFTTVIVLSLDKLVFKPISLVSHALKIEALGKQAVNIPVVNVKETQDLVEAFREMSHQVHIRQKELEYRALHDSLTSLPNRTLLLDRIQQEIHVSKRQAQKFCLLIIDLDDFKEVNDTLGHQSGDDLLIGVGMRINSVLRDIDTVARVGGDEFSILLPNTNEKESIITSKKILSELKKSIKISGVDLSISASIGIAVYPEHGENIHSLLSHADIAMYIAKRNKIGYEIYDQKQDGHSISRLSMTKDFREALENNELNVNYQPIFDMSLNKIVAVEALSRWSHPIRGFVSPEDFVAIAEQIGLINELTYWVLNKSLEHLSCWHKMNKELVGSVNLSVYSFKDPSFVNEVKLALKRHDYPSEKLKLEITEGAMMENPLQAIEVLTELHEMGIKLSVDDFGTGFSSMMYLKQLPVDELKIDKSFIIGLDSDDSNDAIVRSTLDLAHNLGLKVVAEGIENEKVYNLLQSYKCDMAQGYYLSRPIPAEEIEALLKSS